MATDERKHIRRNVRAYRRRARHYERRHGEIFNPVEQERLRQAVARALVDVQTGAERPRVLDFGCGSGNLTGHLLALGAEVVAADVSEQFLALVEDLHGSGPISSFLLNGSDLGGLADESFDLVAAYSVLHHIPDYLSAVDEMARVTRPGGVVYVDHEANEEYWSDHPEYARFQEQVEEARRSRPKRLRRFLDPWHYREIADGYHVRLRRRFNPRYWPEADIHVWPDDHIEWSPIESRLKAQGFDVLQREDYLLYRDWYPLELWATYRERVTDTRTLVARRVRRRPEGS
jgi:SAM-dependent methyltransferase